MYEIVYGTFSSKYACLVQFKSHHARNTSIWLRCATSLAVGSATVAKGRLPTLVLSEFLSILSEAKQNKIQPQQQLQRIYREAAKYALLK